jgi:hypothetical protein
MHELEVDYFIKEGTSQEEVDEILIKLKLVLGSEEIISIVSES